MKTCIRIFGIMALAASISYGKGAKEAGKGQKHADPQKIFKRLDTDGNGSISQEEFKASPKAQKNATRAEACFKRLDSDGNGSLSFEEFKAGYEARKAKGGGKRVK